MANTALNRTTQVLLTNKSGGNLNYGDVVVLDNTNANGFTTTTTSGLSTRGLGVILEPNGIANNASGMVAVGGWCPKINLNTAAAVGQFIKTHTVAGQGTPHASPQVEGDFAVALSASATPACNLFGSPNGPLSGGAGTVTHTAGNLTANAVVLGNAVADITVLGSLGTTTTVLHGNAAGAPTFGAVALATDVSGVLPGLNGGGWVLLEQHSASASASLNFTTCISSAYDSYYIDIQDLIPSGNNQLLWRAGTGGGPTYDSGANYSYDQFVWRAGGSGGAGGTGKTEVSITFNGSTPSASSTLVWSGRMTLASPQSSSAFKNVEGRFIYTDTGFRVANEFRGTYEQTTVMTAFQFLMSAGTITSGTIRCYGLAK